MDKQDLRQCRVCGCTDMDYRLWVIEEGKCCGWIEEDLCYTCASILSEETPVKAERRKCKT